MTDEWEAPTGEQLAKDLLDLIRFETEKSTRSQPMLPPRKPRDK